MKVQVLVAAMHQKDHELLDKMNIQSDVIVGNQCDFNSVEEFEYKGFNAKYLNFKERGVGLNRNNALMRANGDICLIADDDMEYVDNYSKSVIEAYEKLPKADVIVFNLIEEKPTRYIIKKIKKVNKFNYLRYGAARFSFRLKSVKEKAIYFNQCFGGGTEHSAGEDNIFLATCLKNKLKVYSYPVYIAKLLEDRESSWFKGYDEKYLKDKGFLYKTISPRWWKLLCLQDAFRKRKKYNMSFIKAYKTMKKYK